MRQDQHKTDKDWKFIIKKIRELVADNVPTTEACRRWGVAVSRYHAKARELEIAEQEASDKELGVSKP